MNLFLTPEERSNVLDMRRFFETHVTPRALAIEDGHHFPQDIYNLLRAKKYLGYVFPKELGGEGKSYVNYSNLMRESTASDANTSIFVTCFNSLIGDPVCSNTWGRLSESDRADFLAASLTRRLNLEINRLEEHFNTLSPAEMEKIRHMAKLHIEKLATDGQKGALAFLKAPLSDQLDYLHTAHKKMAKGHQGFLGATELNDFKPFVDYVHTLDRQKIAHQVVTYLQAMLHGERVGTFGLTEPNAGSDATATLTFAKFVRGSNFYHPDALWILNGSKTWITLGTNGYLGNRPGFHLIISQTEFGPTAFLLDQGTPGFEIVEIHNKLYMGSTGTSQLLFTDVPLSGASILGRVGDGFHVAFKALDKGRIGIGAQAYGLAYGAFVSAFSYAGQREQFKTPIKFLPQLTQMLGEMKTTVDGIQLLIRYACFLCDGKVPFSTESAMGKLYASEGGQRVTEQAIQVKGGYGYSREEPVGRYYLVSKLTQIYEGSSQVQRQIIANYRYSQVLGQPPSPGDVFLENLLAEKFAGLPSEGYPLLRNIRHGLQKFVPSCWRLGLLILFQDGEHWLGLVRDLLATRPHLKLPFPLPEIAAYRQELDYLGWERDIKTFLGKCGSLLEEVPLPPLPSESKAGVRFHQRFYEGLFADLYCYENIVRLALVRVFNHLETGGHPDYTRFLSEAAALHFLRYKSHLLDLLHRVEVDPKTQSHIWPASTEFFADLDGRGETNPYPRFLVNFLFDRELPE